MDATTLENDKPKENKKKTENIEVKKVCNSDVVIEDTQCMSYDVTPTCGTGPMMDTVCWDAAVPSTFIAARKCMQQNIAMFQSTCE